jgi:hypothetical protein
MVKKVSQEPTRGSIQTPEHGNLSRPTSEQIGQRGRTPPPSKLSILVAVKKHPLIAALVCILGVLAVLILLPSEEKKVSKQFKVLANVVSKEPGENVFTTARKAQEIVPLFDENCELIMAADSVSSHFSRGEIASYVIRSRTHFSDLSLTFVDLSTTFPDRGTANVVLTAKLKGKTVNGERLDETREVKSTLKKIERKWLFVAFEVVEVLKK